MSESTEDDDNPLQPGADLLRSDPIIAWRETDGGEASGGGNLNGNNGGEAINASSAAVSANSGADDNDNNNMVISSLKGDAGIETSDAAGSDRAVAHGAESTGYEAAGQQQLPPPQPAVHAPAGASTNYAPIGDQAHQAGALFASQLYPQNQNPYAAAASSMFHPMLAQYAMLHPVLHPHYQQMTPQQQQMILFQQHLIMQQMAQQSMQQQFILQQQQQVHQQQQQQPHSAAAEGGAPGAAADEGNNPLLQQQMTQQQSIIQLQLLQQSIQQQQILQQQQQQQQFQVPAAMPPTLDQQQQQAQQFQAAHFQAPAAAAAASTSLDQQQQQPGALSATNLAASIPQQQAVAGQDTTSAPTSFPQQQQQATTHPFFWNLPNPLGIPPSGIEAIYQADESNYQAQPALHHDSDDEDADNPGSGRMLLRLVEDHHWVASLQRIATHPRETQQVGIQGRTPLHVACDHDAPPALVQALLNAWPEGAERVGTSQMNPLHITCSSPHACVDVVRVLLGGSRDSVLISGAKDVDGDTPLHAACRCAAPMDVLVTLLHANPITVTWKDYEGLNPLFRLWVRYFVLVGEQIISNIKRPEDIKGDLVEAWEKSLLLLRIMSDMEQQSRVGQMDGQDATSFRVVHAASSVDCPRCVVRIAKVLFPRDLMVRDEKNRLPIHIAAAAPVYAVHDLRGEGFTLDDVDFDEDPETRAARMKNKECKYKEPSVIDILLSGDPKAASERDPRGQLPLHVAIMRGKTLEEGVQALVEAHPDALTTPDSQTDLYPFMLAASVGRGRGDCSTIYGLLRAAPELVHMALTGEPRVEVDDRKPAAVAVVVESSDS